MTTTMINNNDLHQQRVTGFNCPACSGLIPVSALDLIYKRSILCPTCKLELIINPVESQRAIELLKKVEKAEKTVTQTSVPSL